MRATIVIDDDLFAKAQKFADGAEKSAAVREALEAFVERGGRPQAGPYGWYDAEN